ncbi:MAG: response regulator transcription factor [Lachnospiraceae bacterium]|nr:response regulator transcription factor [Lachnospiraceae bacterium]
MDIQIAIVDDRSEERARLALEIHRFFSLERAKRFRLESYASAEEMLEHFQPERFHLVFLDIVMDEMNGIELAGRLRQSDPRLLIVFQTTSREYAFDAFPVHPFDYLIKPFRPEDLDQVMREALRVIRAGDPVVSVTSVRDTFSVPLRNIVAVSSQGHKVELRLTENRSLSGTETYRDLKAKLMGDPRFLEINRGLLINMDQVLSPQEGCMKMQDGSLFPIRVNGRAAVLSAFSQYMISRVDRM